MSTALVILDAMPSAADFYERYWNRQPFAVRSAIAAEVMDSLIAADELAGLAMEEGPQSRMVQTAGAAQGWSCRFGPFDEDDFAGAGENDWCLLVQNVDQFHPDTASLLRHFNFAPRWLMDDIMVSYSTPGGSVGPHIDSYHVFLVQGQGARRWRVGRNAVQNEVYVDGLDLKLLAGGFEGDAIEMHGGDVLYLPPKFAHEGTTLESALTFSVGFLGPKLSQLYSGYGQYLSELENLDERYVGANLDVDSAGFMISPAAVDSVRANMAAGLGVKDFNRWLVEFFTESSHEDFGLYSERDKPLSEKAFAKKLRDGAPLIKPPYVKFAVTTTRDGRHMLGFDRHSFVFDDTLSALVQAFMGEEPVRIASDFPRALQPAPLEFVRTLYNHQALELAS